MFTEAELYTIICALSDTRRMSLRRLIKVSYLIDWCLIYWFGGDAKQRWVYGACGPTDSAIERLITSSSTYLEIGEIDNHYGGIKKEVFCRCAQESPQVDERFLSTLIRVTPRLKGIKWDELLMIVNSTYPMLGKNPGDVLDLPLAAIGYKNFYQRRN